LPVPLQKQNTNRANKHTNIEKVREKEREREREGGREGEKDIKIVYI